MTNISVSAHTQQGNTFVIGSGEIHDSLFLQQMAAWGITIEPSFGTVTYTDSVSNTSKTLKLTSQDDVNALSPGETAVSGWLARIGTTNVPNTSITSVTLSEEVASVPKNFLYNCTNLTTFNNGESQITAYPDGFLQNSGIANISNLKITITTIGDNFLAGTNVARLISLGKVVSIGRNFLAGCPNYNSMFVLPTTLQALGSGFMHNCHAMKQLIYVQSVSPSVLVDSDNTDTLSTVNSDAAMYTTGVGISGNARAAWLAALPNRDTSPYRKLR